MDNSINKLNLPVYRPINNTLVSGDKVQLEDIPEIQSSIIKNSKESPENEARSTATESSINITNEIKEKASNNQHTIPQGKYNIAYDSNATVKPPNGCKLVLTSS